MDEKRGENESGDHASASNCHQVVTEHLHLQLTADFEKKILSGHVLFIFRSLIDNLSSIQLDSGDLNISQVVDNALKMNLEYGVEKGGHPLGLGDVLRIVLANPVSCGDRLYIQVEYETSPTASGLQWLPPQQTDGGKLPFMFSQFEAIHARSTIPCQDSPSVKAPYTASITVPSELTALMSAISKGKNSAASSSGSSSSSSTTSTFTFEQTVAVPSYLIAFAIGDLESREISDRCRIWSEPKKIEECHSEFGNTEEYLQAAENCVFPYEWGRYDLLVLPSSFPYGGMENACLTFVTPTLLAGDRSLTDVVAHEIAHSWMGNLVTNRYWNDFWLNEGFTVFLERKIIGRVKGEEQRQLAHIMGNNILIEAIDRMEKSNVADKYSLLHIEEKGDPDDAFSSVPYEKGSQLLFYLEHLFNAVVHAEFKDQVDTLCFENCVRQWAVKNSGGTVTSQMFQDHVKSFYGDDKFSECHSKIDWNTWLHKPGMPPIDILTIANDVLAKEAKNEANKWLNNEQEESSGDKVKNFSPAQFILFLDTITLGMKDVKEEAKRGLVEALTAALGLDKQRNCERLFRWNMLVLMAKCDQWYPNVVKMLEMQGRMKYLRPLYREMNKVDPELAKKTFKENSFRYHNIAEKMVGTDLGV